MWAGGSLERAICKWQNCQTQILYECVNIISMLDRMMILEEKIAEDWCPGFPKITKIMATMYNVLAGFQFCVSQAR